MHSTFNILNNPLPIIGPTTKAVPCRICTHSRNYDHGKCLVLVARRLIRVYIEQEKKLVDDHSDNLTSRVLTLANAFGFSAKSMHQIHIGAILHDIGKVDIPQEILEKKGPLTKDERKTIEGHPLHALPYLDMLGINGLARELVLYHHEKFDGSGYPYGLKRQSIPFVARMFGLVDIMDAMLSTRPYRAAMSVSQAQQEIKQMSGSHLDPTVVDMAMMVLFEN